MDEQNVDTVLFDLGGVLIDWNPRNMYRSVFDDPVEMEWFLATICTPAWNAEIDAGKPFATAIAERTALFPDHASTIALYRDRWEEMLGGPISASVDLLDRLRAAGRRVVALTNWSAETFPIARRMFDFLSWFEGIVVSGEEMVGKPHAEIFRRAVDRFDLVPRQTLFVDDAAANVDAAAAMGFVPHVFTSPGGLSDHLHSLGLLPSVP